MKSKTLLRITLVVLISVEVRASTCPNFQTNRLSTKNDPKDYEFVANGNRAHLARRVPSMRVCPKKCRENGKRSEFRKQVDGRMLTKRKLTEHAALFSDILLRRLSYYLHHTRHPLRIWFASSSTTAPISDLYPALLLVVTKTAEEEHFHKVDLVSNSKVNIKNDVWSSRNEKLVGRVRYPFYRSVWQVLRLNDQTLGLRRNRGLWQQPFQLRAPIAASSWPVNSNFKLIRKISHFQAIRLKDRHFNGPKLEKLSICWFSQFVQAKTFLIITVPFDQFESSS